MPDINTSNAADPAKTSQIAAGLLSQLGAALGGNTDRDTLFASILAQDNPQDIPPTNNAASQATANNKVGASNAAQSNDDAATSGTTPVSSAGHTSLTDAWRNILSKAREHQRAAQNAATTTATARSGGKTKAAAPAASTTSKPSPSSSSTGAASSMIKPAALSASSAATPADADANDPSTADILAQLQALAQYLQKNLQAAQATGGGNTGDATQNADGTTATSDAAQNAATDAAANNLSIPDILSQFLALSQQLEKGLQAAQASSGASTTDGQTSSATPATASVNPNLAAIETQLKADLKSLLAALQGGDATDAAQTSGATTGATLSASSAPTTANAPQPAPQAQDVAKNLLAVSNDFINLFTSGFGTAAPSAAAANSIFVPMSDRSVAAATGDKSGAFLDDRDGDSDASATTGRTATDAATLNNAVDNSKSASPYSFASQLSATRATSGATGLPSAVEQVILQMNRNVKSGDDQMSIQLHPADLGKINIKLDIASDGKVQGTVAASNPATLDLLLKDVRSLERALQEAGLRADPGSLQFNMSGQSGNSSGQNAGDTSSNPSSGNGNGTALDLAAVSPDASETWYVTPGRVNMKV